MHTNSLCRNEPPSNVCNLENFEAQVNLSLINQTRDFFLLQKVNREMKNESN